MDTEDLDSMARAFAERFEASSGEPEQDTEPDVEEVADASSSMVDSDQTLPEEDIDRPANG